MQGMPWKEKHFSWGWAEWEEAQRRPRVGKPQREEMEEMLSRTRCWAMLGVPARAGGGINPSPPCEPQGNGVGAKHSVIQQR